MVINLILLGLIFVAFFAGFFLSAVFEVHLTVSKKKDYEKLTKDMNKLMEDIQKEAEEARRATEPKKPDLTKVLPAELRDGGN